MLSPSAGSRARSAMTPEKTHDSYIYDGLRGWRSYRPLRPGWGIDITDAFTYRTFASTVRQGPKQLHDLHELIHLVYCTKLNNLH
ncbi:hypothetical protein V1519DRAFT_455616 [Lipomyces tetrasporus]